MTRAPTTVLPSLCRAQPARVPQLLQLRDALLYEQVAYNLEQVWIGDYVEM